jgi:competence protein ComFC
MKIINTIFDTIFPSYCLACQKRNFLFCNKCLASCPSAERESLAWIFPLFDYRHPPIKRAIWMLKYKNKRKLAKIFAEIMYAYILEELSDLILFENFKNPLLIPIPLSKKRFRERGFNQATLICKELIKIDKNQHFVLEEKNLIKNKETKHQAKIENRKERLKNLIGTFEIKKPANLKNRNIILIDDVTTTGATLNEAKKILKQNGAKKIIAFTVAH